MSDNLVVDHHHPLSSTILIALRDARGHHAGTPDMMARAVRAVLDADSTMTITDAYALVNRLWIR